MARARILIVEDENIVALDIERSLKRLDYDVVERASRGEEAIEKAGAHRPDLVLMDIRLKGEMSGIEAADALLKQFGIPVVFLTAYADDPTLQRAKIAEPYGYLLKPFDEKELHTVIEVALHKHTAVESAQAQTQEALRQAEDQLKLFIESVRDYAIFTLDAKGRIQTWNAGAERIKGYRPHEIIGKHFSIFFLPEDIERGLPEQALKTAETEGRFQMEGWHVRKDGSRFWADVIITPVRDQEGNIRGFGEVTRDITERKRAEAGLRASETRYRRLFETSKDGILILDAETGMVVDVNPFLITLLGYSHEQFLGKAIWELGFFKDVVANENNFAKLKAKDYIRYENLPLETSCGRRIEVEFISNVYLVDDIKVIQCNIRDVSARVKAEAALRESEERFRVMANSMSQLAWIARPDGFISWYNERWYEYTGTSPEQMEGWGWQSVHDPEVLPKVMERWKAAIDSGSPFEMEFPLRGADGRFRSFLTRGQPLKDENGNVTQWFGTNTDVEALKQAEEKVQLLNTELERRVDERTAQLEAANKELEAFSYSVSHDLRAPLRAVDGFSQAVIEDYGTTLPAEGQRYLQTIRQGAQKMGMLIDDLLTFSRLSRLPLNNRSVDTGKLVRDALDDLELQQDGRKIDLQIAELPWCWGDPSLLKQVWINLLSNAFKYTRKREAAVVEIGCNATPDGNVFYVKDNGTGFDMRYADKLFGVFQRLHRAEDYEGTGVGLAIVQRVIHRHSGRTWADAAVDQGATFYFTIEGDTKS